MLSGVLQSKIESGHKEQSHDDGSRIKWQSNLVDKEYLAPAKEFQYVGQREFIDQNQNTDHDDVGQQKVFYGRGLVSFKVIEQSDGWNGQKAHKLYSEGKSYHKANEHEPAVTPRVVQVVRPFKSQPKQQCHNQAGHGVYFRFYGIEPKTI